MTLLIKKRTLLKAERSKSLIADIKEFNGVNNLILDGR